jgi:hypothetical protein
LGTVFTHHVLGGDVDDLLHRQVVQGRYDSSVIAHSLVPLVREVLYAATAADGQHVADQVITETRRGCIGVIA